MAAQLTETVKFRIDAATLRGLEQLADEGDRSVAAEMRRALRFHVANADADPEREEATA